MKHVHDDDYRGDSELLHDRDYLKAADLAAAGKDVTLTIARVEKGRELVMVGGVTEYKPVLHFVGTEKMLVLNITNKARLRRMYGRTVADWIGKQVTLYPAYGPDKAEMLREGKEGVRIRERKERTDDPSA